MLDISITTIIIITGIGLITGGMVSYFIQNAHLKKNNTTAEQVLNSAQDKVEKIKKEQLFNFRQEMQRKRSKFYEEFKSKESQLIKTESLIFNKEKDLRRLESNVKYKDTRLNQREQKLNLREQEIYEKHRKVDQIINEQNTKLKSMAGISVEEAKNQLMKNLENQVKTEAAQLTVDMMAEVKMNVQREAKEIIANAIENLAYEFTMESTLSTVQLPNERFKGMIIGREGRNIRAFEDTAGVKVIVDDTPELVVLSAFDPVKREIARLSMESLIKTKNINPGLIEQAVNKATKDVEKSIMSTAEQTLSELGLQGVNNKIKECLGRLKYRYSYGQNMLQHSKEVALLTGSMAAELGFNVKLAKRAGLLHDIGKALTNTSEGSHVQLGVELCQSCREHEVVINAILAHHEEAEPISPISVLVTAADKISGSRPGARRDSLEAYTKRITGLEEIANSFEGVSKTYAISAGREVRVIVQPEKIEDKKAELLSTEIAQKIKAEMEYPGQIKICVIRQTVASKITDEFDESELNEESGN